MTEPTISVRWLEKDDVPKVLAVEQKAHEYLDPDFGVPQLPCYAWGHDDLMEMVRSYKDKGKATFEGRGCVAEVIVQKERPDGTKVREPEVVGCIAYEIQKDGYELLLLSALEDRVRQALLGFVLAKIEASDTRKRVEMVVPDGDYKTLKFLMNSGFTHKFQQNLSPTGHDSWLCAFGAEAEQPAAA